MLVLALRTTCALLLAHRRRRGRDERRGAARHRRASSPPTCRRCARTPARPRQRGEPAGAAGRLADRGQPPRPGVHPRAGRLLAALRAAGARRRPRHGRARRDGRRRASWPPRSTTRWCCPTGGWSRNGNFHGAPVGLRARLPRDRRSPTSPAISRAAHRPVPRRRPQPRPAAVPRRRPGRRLRAHDRPVHPGRRSSPSSSGSPCPAIVDSIPSLGDAGGPRLDGLVGRAQAAPRRRRARPGCSRSSCSPPRAALDLRAPLDARPRHRRGRAGAAPDDVPGPGPDRHLAPEIERGRRFVASGAAVAAAESVTGPLG